MNSVVFRPTLSLQKSFLLCVSAFLIRALVMYFFIQPNQFYKQADSMDYHNCTLSVSLGHGMHRIDTHEPIFWRTPGYPLFLAWFYKQCGISSLNFDHNRMSQLYALWIQILFASLIPLILFYLGICITRNKLLSELVAWIAVFHPGLVLASTYLLTEGIALIFFYLFLLFFYRLILMPAQKPWLFSCILAAINLSLYTWMRPMGEFIALLCAIIIVCASAASWRTRIKQSLLFLVLFFASLAPWYMRNYTLTGEWFFCPTIGTYLNVFSAPKIVRRTTGKNLIECHKILQKEAAIATLRKKQQLHGTGTYVSNNVCKQVCYPIIQAHPFYFIFDWIAEVIKTTIDLYSYQFIPMLDDSFWYDPIEEFLPEKIKDCLYAHAMPWWMRAIAWLECIYALILWIGLFGGLWVFVMNPLITRAYNNPLFKVWLCTILLVGLLVGMTGGFGYARLRLPAEPLMLILSLTFWFYALRKNK